MRKDAKIGFAIGGVLLAVLAVYVLVVPKHNAVSPKGVTLVTPPAGSVDSTQAPEPAPVAVADNPTAPDQTAAVKSDTQAKNDGVDWGKLLSGAADVPPMMSHTPAPGDTEASATPVASVASVTSAVPTPSPYPPAANMPVSDPPTPTVEATAPAAPSASVGATTPGSNSTPALAASTRSGARTYTIKSGQTLSSVAAEVYGNQRFYVAILRANPNINPNRLRAGTKITLPDISDVKPDGKTETAVPAAVKESATVTGNTYKVQAGDNLYRISKKLFGSPKQAEAIYELNKQTIGPDKTRLRLGMVLKLPAAPAVSSR